MTGSRFLRGVIAVTAAAAVGGAAAGAADRRAGAPGRIFFSSNRAANLNPELFAAGENGGPRTQLTPPTGCSTSRRSRPTAPRSSVRRRTVSR